MRRNDVTARFCGVAEAAKVLGVSRMTLYRLIEDGGFPAVRLRSRIVVPVAALEKLESDAVIGARSVDTAELASPASDDIAEECRDHGRDQRRIGQGPDIQPILVG